MICNSSLAKIMPGFDGLARLLNFEFSILNYELFLPNLPQNPLGSGMVRELIGLPRRQGCANHTREVVLRRGNVGVTVQ
jgi:hypothetical protein